MYLLVSVNKTTSCTVHKKMKFSIKDIFSNCDQIRSLLRTWSNLLKKSLTEDFIFRTVVAKHSAGFYLSWFVFQF